MSREFLVEHYKMLVQNRPRVINLPLICLRHIDEKLVQENDRVLDDSEINNTVKARGCLVYKWRSDTECSAEVYCSSVIYK